MLPGFRFLFAAIMLSMSLLIFGLGATALLRAAHESFASNSSWRAAPEVPFAQQRDTTLPMLAALRVEPTTISAAPADQQDSPAESAGGEQVAALRPGETPPAEIAKPSETPSPMPFAENMPASEAASVGAVSPTGEATAAGEQKMTAVAALDTLPASNELAAAQTEPAATTPANSASGDSTASTSATTAIPATAPEASVAVTRIATLGGPPVDIAGVASASAAKSDHAKSDDGVKKRVHARRALHRRRLTARARLLAQQQLQANPFAQQPQQTFPPAPPRQ
jgi:hypothetical protein